MPVAVEQGGVGQLGLVQVFCPFSAEFQLYLFRPIFQEIGISSSGHTLSYLKEAPGREILGRACWLEACNSGTLEVWPATPAPRHSGALEACKFTSRLGSRGRLLVGRIRSQGVRPSWGGNDDWGLLCADLVWPSPLFCPW